MTWKRARNCQIQDSAWYSNSTTALPCWHLKAFNTPPHIGRWWCQFQKDCPLGSTTWLKVQRNVTAVPLGHHGCHVLQMNYTQQFGTPDNSGCFRSQHKSKFKSSGMLCSTNWSIVTDIASHPSGLLWSKDEDAMILQSVCNLRCHILILLIEYAIVRMQSTETQLLL